MPDGAPLTIKVYGRDAYDNQMLEKLWRTLWYRDGGSAASGLNRAKGAEREALLTLLARNAGAPTAEVVTVGATRAERLAARPARLGQPARLRCPPERSTMRSSATAGRGAIELGAANVAHGHISPAALRVPGRRRSSSSTSAAASSRPTSTTARPTARSCSATTAAVAGTERAVAAARRRDRPRGV